ncbi:Hsp20/alpha crystallin family protein [Petroclostridium sp. X23]|uniref:Hsp20/alpha crystallin family protein n=1 Tax=Petroclostridium sp. X23 TaxID=3045146 RepID=UPI0024AC8C83|nr:Hsp20/alpha crystallin family protein [Petroclostridium sp. X23]WHH58191.1 Hsp20/alpha crystallin family protein [Petroclostridium sp. X23]
MFDLVPFRKRHGDLVSSFFGRDFMDNFFSNDFFLSSTSGIRADIKENEKEYVVEAELPGVNKESIEVELKDDYLTISANHNEEINEERENYIRKERRTGKISRSFYVESVKNEAVKATFDNGILKLILPKTGETKKKGYKIDIN